MCKVSEEIRLCGFREGLVERLRSPPRICSGECPKSLTCRGFLLGDREGRLTREGKEGGSIMSRVCGRDVFGVSRRSEERNSRQWFDDRYERLDIDGYDRRRYTQDNRSLTVKCFRSVGK